MRVSAVTHRQCNLDVVIRSAMVRTIELATSTSENTERRFPLRRRAIAFLAVCAAMFIFHSRILTAIGAQLVYQDPQPEDADILAISGDGSLDEVLTWLRQHDQSRLILVERPPPRVVQIGAAQSDADRRRQLSEAAGVASERIEILSAESFRQVHPMRIMAKWLTHNPTRNLYVLSDQFHSRRLRLEINRQLPQSQSSRIMIQPLPDRRFGVIDWWHSRLGVRSVFAAYVGWVRTWLGLRAPDPPPYLSPDEYEEQFLASIGYGP